MRFLLSTIVALIFLAFAGCGRPPVGETRKLGSIVKLKSVSTIAKKSTRVFGKKWKKWNSAKATMISNPKPAYPVKGKKKSKIGKLKDRIKALEQELRDSEYKRKWGGTGHGYPSNGP